MNIFKIVYSLAKTQKVQYFTFKYNVKNKSSGLYEYIIYNIIIEKTQTNTRIPNNKIFNSFITFGYTARRS